MEEEFFDKKFFTKERIKKLFFDVYNNNPDKEMHWVLDMVCEIVLEFMNDQERDAHFKYLAELRFKLAAGAKDGFKTKEFLFPTSVQKSDGESKKTKDLKAAAAASGELEENLIRDHSIDFSKYLQTPESILQELKESRKNKNNEDEEENKPN
ncbi:MAG: hypothetical protein NT034_02185 [Candidatus Magasanikbacteria bacterium]|nr:hypothetical protein [Candidatus Magasanikbacteria bacterium]